MIQMEMRGWGIARRIFDYCIIILFHVKQMRFHNMERLRCFSFRSSWIIRYAVRQEDLPENAVFLLHRGRSDPA